MCDAGTMLSAGASVFEKMEQQRATNEHAAKTRANAVRAQNDEGDSAQQRFVEDNRTAVQEAYEAALEGRQTLSSQINQAADSGVMGISVNDVLFAQTGSNARKDNKFVQELNSRKTQFEINMAGLGSQTQNQINSAPVDNSNPLMGAVAPLGQAAQGGKFDSFLIKKGD